MRGFEEDGSGVRGTVGARKTKWRREIGGEE